MRDQTCWAIVLAGLFFAVSAHADTHIITPACGTEGARSCGITDPEFYGINYFVGKACDWGLKDDNGTCVNDSRRTITPGWTQWAMDEQRYGINLDSPINQIVTFGTHNSFSTYNAGFANSLGTDQAFSITDQLQAGARSIRIDGVYFDNEMRLCHGLGNEDSSTGTTCMTLSAPYLAIPWSSGRLTAFAFDEVRKWMNDNPSQFLALQLNGAWLGDCSTCGKSGSQLMADLIKHYFGDILVRGNDVIDSTGTYTWDTMRHYLAMGRRIVIFSFPQIRENPAASDAGDIIAFSKTDLLNDISTYPVNGLTTCTDSHSNAIHSDAQTWSEAGEDRSGSASVPAGFIGYMDEQYVMEATACGASLINLDFLNARYDTFPPAFVGAPQPSFAVPDRRAEATIWSYAPNDFGQAGPTVMGANGRWSSDPLTTSHPYACAKPAANNPDLWVNRPTWVLSPNSGAWLNGTSSCPHGYTFSFPKNARQNADLAAVANGKVVWLNYHVRGVGINTNPGFAGFSMQAGAGVPRPQTVTITEWVPGSRIHISAPASATWLNVPSDVPVNGASSVAIPVKITDTASSLANGVYAANLTLTGIDGAGNPSSTNLLVRLTILSPTVVTVAASPNPAPEGGVVTLTGIVLAQNPSLVSSQLGFNGTMELREMAMDSNGAPVITTVASATVTATGVAHFGYSPTAGAHKLFGVYMGNAVFEQSSSAALTLNVTPYFQPSVGSISKSFPAGSPPSGIAASVSFTGAANTTTTVQTSCNGQQPCSWLEVEKTIPVGGSVVASLSYGPAASRLGVGTYQALVTISDGVHQSSSVTFNLTVTGTMSSSTSSVALMSTGEPVSAAVQMSTSGAMDVTAQASTSDGGNWLSVMSMEAPGTMMIEANPANMSPGIYNGAVTVSSPVANNSLVIHVQFEVTPPHPRPRH